MNRPYRKTRRAEAQEATRQRIVEAAIALHEELGPRATTISAIAERAGVQRLTVYRHFPDDESLFQACSSGWMDLNPLPDIEALGAGLSPGERLAAAISAFHRYYRQTEGMLTSIYRDASLVPAVAAPVEAMTAEIEASAAALAAGVDNGDSEPVRASIGHALAFATWRDLAGRGLADEAITGLTLNWIEGAQAPCVKRPAR